MNNNHKIDELKKKNEILQSRIKKLARRNAHLSLLTDVLNDLAPIKGIENIIDYLIGILINNIGGTNIGVYYIKDSHWYYRDILGNHKVLDELDDENIKMCLNTGKYHYYDTDEVFFTFKLGTQTTVRNWVYPLIAADEVIGAIKYEGLLVHLADEIIDQIQTISNYSALAMQNELLNRSRIKIAYNQLKEQNHLLEEEIKERKKAQTQAIKLEEQLQQSQKMEAIGTLAGGIAHDFNNILMAILGFADLGMEISENETLKNYLSRIMEAGERAKELVSQILTFSRKGDTKLKPLQVQLILKEVTKLLRASIPTTIEIKVNIDNNCKPILANAVQIHQVIMNLCTNAKHAMEDNGGILQITLKEVEDINKLYPQISKKDDRKFVSLQIKDTGTGIDNKTMKRIFEPYFTTKGISKGTGMGLAVVHGIIHVHKGYIFVDSQVKKGTTFTCFFPICSENVTELNINENIGPTSFEGTALIVDDEPMIVEVAETILHQLGIDTKSFTNPELAFDNFNKNSELFKFIITDQTMPKMTGLELSKKIRDAGSEIPIILFSGFSNKINEKTLKEAGIDFFAEKPYSKSTLIKAITTIYNKTS